MTRGRHRNVAHLVAESVDDARSQWVDIFNRDRADLGPRHAAERAADDIDRYGPNAPPPRHRGTAGRGAARRPTSPTPTDPGSPTDLPRDRPLTDFPANFLASSDRPERPGRHR